MRTRHPLAGPWIVNFARTQLDYACKLATFRVQGRNHEEPQQGELKRPDPVDQICQSLPFELHLWSRCLARSQSLAPQLATFDQFEIPWRSKIPRKTQRRQAKGLAGTELVCNAEFSPSSRWSFKYYGSRRYWRQIQGKLFWKLESDWDEWLRFTKGKQIG